MNELFISDKILENLTNKEQEKLNILYHVKEKYSNTSYDFSVCITDKLYRNLEKYNLIYIINKDLSVKEDNHIRILSGELAKLQAFELAAKDFINRKKSILLYLGKFPGFGFDIDGGSILAKQLIDSLKIRSNLSVCFIRKNNETFFDEEVCEVKYLEYKDPWNNKFIRRLENLDTNYEALRGYENYDLIIAAHISKFFGMNNVGNDFWKKTIIFPMFCTSSYVRVGEHVPPDYTLQERVVVENVSKIITPSEDEKNDLIADYKCDESKIFVIRRGISPYIHYCERSLKVKNNSINLVCIGTIKLQKNTKATLKLIKLLRQKNIECKLNLVATIQDRQYYDEFRDLVHAEMLSEYVKYHISVTQKDLANLLEEMDINVSMSSWETFGRGIFEGASSGLPTFVFDCLKTVKQLSENNAGFYFANSIEHMADAIAYVISDRELYNKMSKHLFEISRRFSYKYEENLLMDTIFNK